jgi:chromate transport protein ChrA
MTTYFIIGVVFSTLYMMFRSHSIKASLWIQIAVFLIMMTAWLPIIIVAFCQSLLELVWCLKETKDKDK